MAPETCVVIEKHILAEWTRGPFAGMRLIAAGYGAGTLMPPHAHATASVSLVLGGMFAERIGSGRRIGPGLGVLVKPVGVVHETLSGAHGCRTISLEVPARIACELHSKFAAFSRVAHDDDPRLTAAMLRLWMHARESQRDGSRKAASDAAWMAAWWRGLGDLLATSPERRVDHRLQTALAVGATGGSVAEAARAAGVHPVHLCRLFRTATGRGAAANFVRARVRCAAEELAGRLAGDSAGRVARGIATRGVSLAAVAAATGFADQAHLTRAFAREVGVPPGVFRSLIADHV